jgi:hypothetical protein
MNNSLTKILREAARYRTLRSIYGDDGLYRIEIANGLPKIDIAPGDLSAWSGLYAQFATVH